MTAAPQLLLMIIGILFPLPLSSAVFLKANIESDGNDEEDGVKFYSISFVY